MGSKDFFHILTSEYERPCPKDMPGTPNSIFTKTNRVAVWASPHVLILLYGCFDLDREIFHLQAPFCSGAKVPSLKDDLGSSAQAIFAFLSLQTPI